MCFHREPNGKLSSLPIDQGQRSTARRRSEQALICRLKPPFTGGAPLHTDGCITIDDQTRGCPKIHERSIATFLHTHDVHSIVASVEMEKQKYRIKEQERIQNAIPNLVHSRRSLHGCAVGTAQQRPPVGIHVTHSITKGLKAIR